MTHNETLGTGAGKRILIAEDELDLAQEMAEALEDHGFLPHIAESLDKIREILELFPIDLVLLDRQMGTVDMLDHLDDLRDVVQGPIVIVTGNRAERDLILGLNRGADDVLLKPVSGDELAARIHAHLRRTAPHREVADPQLHENGWQVWHVQRVIHRPDGQPVKLSVVEFNLLALLMSTPGQPVSRDLLARKTFGRDLRPAERTLDSLFHRIRRALGARSHSECIVALRNQGYMFTGFPPA